MANSAIRDCIRCEETKLTSEFHKSISARGGISDVCTECTDRRMRTTQVPMLSPAAEMRRLVQRREHNERLSKGGLPWPKLDRE